MSLLLAIVGSCTSAWSVLENPEYMLNSFRVQAGLWVVVLNAREATQGMGTLGYFQECGKSGALFGSSHATRNDYFELTQTRAQVVRTASPECPRAICAWCFPFCQVILVGFMCTVFSLLPAYRPLLV